MPINAWRHAPIHSPLPAFQTLGPCSELTRGERERSPQLTEFPALGGIAGFISTKVQWKSLDLGELPC